MTLDQLLNKYGPDINANDQQALYDWLADLFDRGVDSNRKDSKPAVSTDQKDKVRKFWAEKADRSTAVEAFAAVRQALELDVYGDEGSVANLIGWHDCLVETLATVKRAISFETRLALNITATIKSDATPKADVETAQQVLNALTMAYKATGRGLSPQMVDGEPRTFSLPRGKFKWAEDADAVTTRPSFTTAPTVTVYDDSGEIIYDETGADLGHACKLVGPGFTDENLRAELTSFGDQSVFDPEWTFTHPDTGYTITGVRS